VKKTLAGVIAFVLLSFSVACEAGDDDDLEDRSLDEHACDEAAEELAECCPGVKKESIACRVQTSSGGCDSRTTRTDVLIPLHDADECILHSSCADLVERGVCDALASARRYSSATSSGDPTTTTSAVSVCPSLRTGGSGEATSSSSSSSSGETMLPPPKPPTPEPTQDEESPSASCEGDASTCSWYITPAQCEAMGCTWIPR